MQEDQARFEQLIEQGLAASRNQQADTALALFAQAGQVAPDSGVPHFLIGSEHASTGQLDAAERAFANAVLLAPHFHLARYQLGLLQFSTGRAGAALVSWQPLTALPDGEPMGHFVRGFAALAQDGLADALTQFRRGLAVAGAHAALAADIARVVEAVERLLAGTQPPAQAAADHVLLTSYGRGLH